MTPVSVKIHSAPPLSKKEILRYAGGGDESVISLMDECLSELLPSLTYKSCRIEVSVTPSENGVMLSDIYIPAQDLAKNLKDCKKAVVFAATVGFAPDRAIAKYSVVSPTRALLFQAIGAERIEALCDEISGEYRNTRPRFSPGYGDLPLSFQKEIFTLLSPTKHLGVILNESLLMSPSKSVTAIMGLKETSL